MSSHQPKRLENHLGQTEENDEMTMTTMLMPITSQTNKNQSNRNTKINTPSCQENRLVDGVTINRRTMSVSQNVIMDMHFLVRTCQSVESQLKVGLFHQPLGAMVICHQLNTVKLHRLATDTTFAKRRAMDMATVTDMVTDTDIVPDTDMVTDIVPVTDTDIVPVTDMDTDIMAANAVMMEMIEVNTTAINTETNTVTDMDTDTLTLSTTDSSSVAFDATPDSDQLMADGLPGVIKTMVSGRFHIPIASRK
jgi:hypothetical protein